MIPADFEESEYRGPLYNQLERGNHLVWEPGQVFEKHIGIDRSAYVTDPIFWQMQSFNDPMPGVLLPSYEWDYIWKTRMAKKVLPDFQLNLFTQAKRPFSGTRPRKILKEKGISNSYWKFEIKRHQQLALERMSNNISSQALVCYASPAFHTQGALYTHTRNMSVVQSSTFPPVNLLTGHTAWYYDCGGATGVANPEVERIEAKTILEQIDGFVRENESLESKESQSLIALADGIVESQYEISDPSSVDTWFQFMLKQVEETVATLYEVDSSLEAKLQEYRAYLQIRTFCSAHHLDWYVLGHAS